MSQQSSISFDNTEYAFAYKNDKELKRAHFLFSSMGKPWLVNAGIKLTPWAVKNNIPLTKTIIRNTIFPQFVGGETLEETARVADKLEKFGVQVILDYGVEGNDNGDESYEHSMQQFIKVIEYAATQHNIPFMSIKVTGMCRFGLLEKLDHS
ncbi:MAG: proline dehydrogenase, partial [Sphingobacteriales bacterium]|nr:proline dehydrogenase [Sphingobacteriales bacterium]